MLSSSILPRVFIHKENGQELTLTDPNPAFSPEAVMNFYAPTYPILTNARLTGPEIKKDTIQYRFESTMGTKG
ncbi:PRTRC system protein C [Mucilaginibacter gossypiicola]|uniref:PRTRC system protein C n=1 Tax=Mucilaginibacter gossypiicola TaxID=551995 RepID=A0A1H8LSU2_9SPHI|nr:PRTRC system protein C [Mucilaginibacter gossypiicola]SEO07928.1 PRTRC system protein C [Mucilaginibacter gossypiicola]